MLFNSFEFIFVFLPACWIIAMLAARTHGLAVVLWLIVASGVFYGWWSLRDLLIVAGSIACNYGLGRSLNAATLPAARRALLIVGVSANLALLVWFKYAAFAEALIDPSADLSTFRVAIVALPLGISFYTFTQIAFLVDVYRQPVAYDLPRYSLFVVIFPHLIAGPIVRHGEMVPQFREIAGRLTGNSYLRLWAAPALVLFAVGLAKKTLLADTFGDFADPAFEAAEIDFLSAWAAATTYAFQLYFDFSAYSDMALALGLLLGVELPVNFFSPYKATSFSDFWRRWHISLSSFLRDYLYIPLGGNRRGLVRRHVNLMATMLLGGLWHGANWTFLLWGALHGAFLVLQHALEALIAWRPPRWLAVATTFALVVFAWVPFRAPDLDTALRFMASMLLVGHVSVPDHFADLAPVVASALPFARVDVGDSEYLYGLQHVALLGLGFAICWAAPSSMALYAPEARARIVERPALPAAAGGLLALSLIVLYLRDRSTFLYFQF